MKNLQHLSILILSITLFLNLTACDCIEGEGPIRTENRSVDDFNGIDLDIAANVIVTKSDEFSFEIQAQENLHDFIKTRVEGGSLRIYINENCINSRGIEIHISMPEIEELEVGGSGSITLEDHFKSEKIYMTVSGSGDIEADVTAKKIECDINGSGSIELYGNAEKLKIGIRGSGDVEALRLVAEDVYVGIYGSGNSRVFAEDFLEVYIAGSGNVKYKGRPDIDSDIDGSGNLVKLR